MIKKEKNRGYNQATIIAEPISKLLNKPLISNYLIKSVETDTQTKKNRLQRYENMKEIFQINKNVSLDAQNILLIDDVITTGATIESCANTLLAVNCNLKIYVATLAYAI